MVNKIMQEERSYILKINFKLSLAVVELNLASMQLYLSRAENALNALIYSNRTVTNTL